MALTNATTDAIGQHTATLKVDGDDSPSDIYFAVRTTGPYVAGDAAIIRSGEGAIFTRQMPNISRQYCLVTDISAGTLHYWGATTTPSGYLSAENLYLPGTIQQGTMLAEGELQLLGESLFGGAEIAEGPLAERSRVVEQGVSIVTGVVTMGVSTPVLNALDLILTPNVSETGFSTPVLTLMAAEPDAEIVVGSFTTVASPPEETSTILLAGVLRG